jgi:hypothetical protein
VAVIDHPTAAWTAQQLRDAFPDQEAPAYLSMIVMRLSQERQPPSA